MYLYGVLLLSRFFLLLWINHASPSSSGLLDFGPGVSESERLWFVMAENNLDFYVINRKKYFVVEQSA